MIDCRKYFSDSEKVSFYKYYCCFTVLPCDTNQKIIQRQRVGECSQCKSALLRMAGFLFYPERISSFLYTVSFTKVSAGSRARRNLCKIKIYFLNSAKRLSICFTYFP